MTAISEGLRRSAVRLLTLVGPAGVGKTRLTLAAAGRLADAFDDVIVVPLAATSDPARVPAAVAGALGLREVPGTTFERAVFNCLRDQAMLLVLDNVEHLLPSTPFVVDLLTNCPSLKALVTSRERLHVAGEHEFAVSPLELPDLQSLPSPDQLGGCEAVALFLDRVQAFQPEFALTDANAAVVAEICARLDGLPLAIELAAARIKILSPTALLHRLANQLDLLIDGSYDQPAHQRTMRGTIEWSYALLTPMEQACFRRLSVFAGGFTLAAADAVSDRIDPATTLNGVGSLVDKSLVYRAGDVDGEPRFGILQAIRAYGLERLEEHGEGDEVRHRHATYFLALADQGVAHLYGSEQGRWLDRLELDYPNLRLALTWFSSTGDEERFMRLASALFGLWRNHGHLTEGRAWLEQASACGTGDPALDPLRAKLLYGAGVLAVDQADYQRAIMYGEDGLALARRLDDRNAIGRALSFLGGARYTMTDYEEARALLEEALACYRTTGHAVGTAGSLNALALTTMDAGLFDRAEELFAEAKAAFEAIGNEQGVAYAIDNLSVALYTRGKIGQAETLTNQALEIKRRLGDKRGVAIGLDHAGLCAGRHGHVARAWSMHEESLALRREIGSNRGFAVWLAHIAALLAACGDAEHAITLLGASDALRDAARIPRFGHELIEHRRVIEVIRIRLNADAYAAGWERGRAMPVDEAMSEAVRMASAAVAAQATDEARRAADPFGLTAREHEVLRLVIKLYTDKEIASALSISPRTVARHMAGILGKLNVHSRHAAAAVAVQHGLGNRDRPTP